jgi:hypothetical protein
VMEEIEQMSQASTGLGHDERRAGPLKPLTVTVGAASAISGISTSKIWVLIKQGVLPVTRLGRCTLVHYAPLEELILSGGQPPRSMPRNRWDKAAAEATIGAAVVR